MFLEINRLKIRKSSHLCSVFFFFIATFLLESCTNNVIYEQSVDVDKNAWHLDSIICFDVPVEDSLIKYNLCLKLSYRESYPYSNIFFFVDVIDSKNQLFTDTIQCILSDSRGHNFGKKSGDNIKQELIYRYNSYFPIRGLYTFRIQHAMRDTLLKGFNSVGLKLVEYSN